MRKTISLASATLVISLVCFAQNAPQTAVEQSRPSHGQTSSAHVCARCVRAHMDFLASDALRGRGSGTHDEWVAATYIGSELEQYGVAPAAENGSYLQDVTISKRKVAAPPQIAFKTTPTAERETVWVHGKEMLVLHLGAASFSGPLAKVDSSKSSDHRAAPGSVVLLTGAQTNVQEAVSNYASEGVAAVIIPASERLQDRWDSVGSKLPTLPTGVGTGTEGGLGERFTVVAVKADAMATLEKLPDGTSISVKVETGQPETSHTWNVVGKIEGADGSQKHEVILLTAHLDHLGVGPPVHGDDIYNGADDDASGTTAVLELARVLASQPKPRRTVVFALFGSEETGGLGSTYFRQHPPMPLKHIAAYLEFEMIGRRDPAVAENTLWLTGWKRTDLGPVLAEHGAHLVGDPHPNQDFFRRSDNYVFAKQGVVAQTVSSYGLHSDYHQPSDDLAHIDFKHMDEAIDSLLKPVLWLVNSDFVPKWKEGGRP
jgi:aminopeptidase YwaD